MRGDVLHSALAELRRLDGLSGVRFDRVTVGDSVLLVELRKGQADVSLAGIAHRPDDATATVTAGSLEALLAPIDATAGPEPTTDTGEERLERAVSVATLNALSAPYLEWQSGDPMELLAPDVERIVTVGLFRPAFRKFADIEVRVIEREGIGTVTAPDSVSVRRFSTEETEAAMEGADVVFVTGSTLVYGGMERYLAAAPESSTLVVVGATASFHPEPLFEAGVDVVAGAEITNPERVRSAIRAGACGTDLHDNGVRKVYTTPGIATETNLQLDT